MRGAHELRRERVSRWPPRVLGADLRQVAAEVDAYDGSDTSVGRLTHALRQLVAGAVLVGIAVGSVGTVAVAVIGISVLDNL